MLKKFGMALGPKRIKKTVRYDVAIAQIENLPANITSCRVVWLKDSKIQMTKTSVVKDGALRSGRWQSVGLHFLKVVPVPGMPCEVSHPLTRLRCRESVLV